MGDFKTYLGLVMGVDGNRVEVTVPNVTRFFRLTLDTLNAGTIDPPAVGSRVWVRANDDWSQAFWEPDIATLQAEIAAVRAMVE